MPINPLDQSNSGSDNTDEVATNPLSGASNNAPPSAGSNVSGASTSASGGSGGGGSQQKPSSTGFTNVNQYVNANADQGAGLGNAIAQNVNQQASQGLQGLSQAQSDFGNQVKAQGANPNQYSTGQVSQTIQNDLNDNNPNATGVQSDIQQFNNVAKENTNFQAGTDTAPKSLTQVSSYSPADSQLQQAEQAANLTGTESGRATLLQGGTVQSSDPNNPNAQVNITGGFARPNYTTGQVNLDQLLTQNLPQNANTLGNLRNNLLGQYGLANTENQAIQNAATTRQGVVQGTQQAEQNIQDVLYGIPAGTPVDANGNPIYPGSNPATATSNLINPGSNPATATSNLINTGATEQNPFTQTNAPQNTNIPANGNPIEPGQPAPFSQTNAPQNTNIPVNGAPISIEGGTSSAPSNSLIQVGGSVPYQPPAQYGILSNLYSQLQGAPSAQNAAQTANMSSAVQNMTTYLQQAYGNNILGVPVAQLAQQIVTSNSPIDSANTVNTMTPQQLNELQTLNQFGGLTGGNINQLGQTGGVNTTVIDPTTIGTNQFDPGTTNTASNAQQTLQTGENAFQSNLNAMLTTGGSLYQDTGTLFNNGANSIFNGKQNMFANYNSSNKNSGPNQYQTQITNGQQALEQINGIEGTNIQLPESYIQNGLASAASQAAKSGRQVASGDITNAGLALAYTQFLSALQANPDAALGGSNSLNLGLAPGTNIYGNSTAPSSQPGFNPTTNGGMQRPTG